MNQTERIQHGFQKKMVWRRLLTNQCPKPDCGKKLEYIEPSVGAGAYARPKFICSGVNCEYVITQERMEQLCMDMQAKQLERHALPEQQLGKDGYG